MKYHGVVYDVGLRFAVGQAYSVERFDADLVTFDINAIATAMHANAIRIEGEEIDRLVAASRIAQAAGLSVFFNPWKMNVSVTELPGYFAQAARAAEQLRNEGVDITFVTGCEITLFNEGIIRGATLMERITWLADLAQEPQSDNNGTVLLEQGKILNDILRAIVTAVRNEFHGAITYSAGMWEIVDWDIFDLVGVDHYRSNESPEEYIAKLDRYPVGKPLMVMEVGSCAYEGAGILGAGGFMRLQGTNPDGTGNFADDIIPTRSEREQADYVEEQLRLLGNAGVDGTFIYVFSFPTYRYGEGRRDLDMMSFSLVKTYPDSHPKSKKIPPWEPKEAFYRIAGIYRAVSKMID